MKMIVNCGTKNPREFEIELDAYDNAVENEATEKEKDIAYNELKRVLSQGSSFANSGNRNDPAVNSCICLHVLGYNPVTWFNNFFFDVNENDELFYEADIRKYKEHVSRVCDYIDVWGPEGNEGESLDYLV